MHCHFARPDQIAALGPLVAHSFPAPGRSPAWWDEQLRAPLYGGGADTLLVGEADGQPVAACQLHPLRQWVGGTALPTAGLGSVAIAPSHRRRGLANQLVSAALRAARERGDVVSSLYPFRAAFYRNLGYGHAGAALQYQIPPGALPDSEERRHVELLADDGARGAALGLYNAWARGQTGQLERGERIWTHLCTVPDRILVGYRAAALEGYALAAYRTDVPLPDRFLEVEELVWTTAAARRGLEGWLASLGDQWSQLLIRTLPSQRFGDRLREPRLPAGAAPAWGLWTPAATLLLGTMFRLVDLRAAWERRRVNTGAPLVVALNVTDAQLEENAGCWRLACDDGAVTVSGGGSAAGGPLATALTLRLDVATLSRLYIGAITPSAACAAELLECDRPERLPLLDATLALPEPWTFDRF